MMDILTITGQSLDDFFYGKVPDSLREPLGQKLRILKVLGKKCIGSFVFQYNDLYYFQVVDPYSECSAKIYISFLNINIKNIILIIDVV